MAYPQPTRPAPVKTGGGCAHAPIANERGDVVSPVKQYGVAQEPRFFCARCKRVITEDAARTALGVGSDEPM